MSKTNKSEVNTPKFNVGDRVKLVKEVTLSTPDFQNTWVPSMTDKIGSTFTIESINRFGISFEEENFRYPPASLVKVGFSNFDEVIKYMKCGGYVLADLFKSTVFCYRIKKGVLEVNNPDFSEMWGKSLFGIIDIQKGRIANISDFTKRKY